MIDGAQPEAEALTLQEAMSYLRIAWDIVMHDAEIGVLDDDDLTNVDERMASVETMLNEHLHQSSPMTHGNPLAVLTPAEIQEAYYRLPFAAADATALPLDDLIARMRALAQRGSLATCVAYAQVVSDRLRDAAGLDESLRHDVRDALHALRERFRVPLFDDAHAQREEAEQALTIITAMRQEVKDLLRATRHSLSRGGPGL